MSRGGSGSEDDMGRARGQGKLHPRGSGGGKCPQCPVSVPNDPAPAGPSLPPVSRHADTDRVQLLRVLRGHEISPE